MKKQKNTYMVAVQVTLRPVVYIEVVADNARDAVKSVQNDAMSFVEANRRSFHNEVKTDLTYIDRDAVRTISAGRADQYHSEAECSLCRGVKKGKSLKKGAKSEVA